MVPLAAPLHPLLADGHRGAEHALPLRCDTPSLAASGPIGRFQQAAALALHDVTVRLSHLVEHGLPLPHQLLLHRSVQVSSRPAWRSTATGSLR